ncbi:hypothetical protein ACFQFG_08680 [Methylobacterium persicinum]
MFGSDGSPIIQYLVIFAVIFSALAAIVFVVRRLTGAAAPCRRAAPVRASRGWGSSTSTNSTGRANSSC